MEKEEFIELSKTKSKDKLKKAINEGFMINDRFTDGTYPLFIAIEQGEFKFAKYCVEFGAKTDIVDGEKNSVVNKCYEANQGPYLIHEFTKVGIKPFINTKTINVLTTYGMSALCYAIFFRRAKDVKILLENGANVDEINIKSGRSAFFLASFPEKVSSDEPESKKGIEVVKEMVKFKPNPNIQDTYEKSVFPLATPLMKACFEKNYGIAREILKLKNIDWTLCDDEGYTTFTFVCNTNQKDLILKSYQKGYKNIDLEEVIKSEYYAKMTQETKSLIEKLKLEKSISIKPKKQKTPKI